MLCLHAACHNAVISICMHICLKSIQNLSFLVFLCEALIGSGLCSGFGLGSGSATTSVSASEELSLSVNGFFLFGLGLADLWIESSDTEGDCERFIDSFSGER